MQVVKGDLIDLFFARRFRVIIQGCNCFNTMNSGIARQIRERIPEAYEADCRTVKGDADKLGTISLTKIDCFTDNSYYVVNAYTQYKYGRDRMHVDYDAVRSCFKEINETWPVSSFDRWDFGYPRIGAGLAGGDWNIIRKIIDEELSGRKHTLVEYEP